MKTITLHIEGMMCQNCKKHVDKALNAIEGVQADVNLEENKAVCIIAPAVEPETLKAAVEEEGYKVVSME